MVAVALPDLRADFDVGVASLALLVSAYLIAVAVVQPLAGRLGDSFGHLRVARAGLLLLACFSLGAAFAWDFTGLVVVRALQGTAAALVMPNITAFLRTSVDGSRLGRILGLNAAALSTGAALGPLAGGLLLAAGSWRLLFIASAPLAVLALALTALVQSGATPRRRSLGVDPVSLVLLALAFTALTAAGNARRLGSPALLAVAVALFPLALALYVLRCRHHRGVADLTLFGNRTYAAAAAGTALTNLVMYTALIALPVYLGDLRRLGGLQVGLVLFAMSAAMVVLSAPAGRLSDRLGPRRPGLLAALGLIAGASGLVLATGGGPWLMLGPVLAVGVAMGLGQPPLQAAALGAWPPEVAGSASGALSLMRYVGSVTAAALIASILGSDPGPDSFRALFAVVAVFALGNVAAALALPSRPAPVEPAPTLSPGLGRQPSSPA
jgi:MFS family permease